MPRRTPKATTPPDDVDPRFERMLEALARVRGFATIVAAYRAESETGGRKAFGSNALKVGGKIFAFASKGRLIVKLPRESAVAIVEGGEGSYFDLGHGRVMKQWVAIDHERTWLARAQEAHAFVKAG